jgi:hypothetical protein
LSWLYQEKLRYCHWALSKLRFGISESGVNSFEKNMFRSTGTMYMMIMCVFMVMVMLQKLEENEDDSYTNSPWADPKMLKCQFQGTTSIRYK